MQKSILIKKLQYLNNTSVVMDKLLLKVSILNSLNILQCHSMNKLIKA